MMDGSSVFRTDKVLGGNPSIWRNGEKRLMKNIQCGIRIFKIDLIKTGEEREICCIEAVNRGKRSLFRVEHYSENVYLLFSVGNSSLDFGLYELILKELLARKVISEETRLVRMDKNQ
ncbi:MAG: hypothetical protein ACYCYP_03000 [Leptospirales bacterium]